jgi:hypothetical protein
MKSADKVQLNLCVDKGTDALFRHLAMAAGFGKRPSPFLLRLLSIFQGNMRDMSKRVSDVIAQDPGLLKSREQRFYAQELIMELQKALAAADQEELTP